MVRAGPGADGQRRGWIGGRQLGDAGTKKERPRADLGLLRTEPGLPGVEPGLRRAEPDLLGRDQTS